MKADPIVAEIRKTREAHAKRFGFNLMKICRDLRKIENTRKHCAVRRRLTRKTARITFVGR
jgi:hypothetical protein